MPVLLVGVVKPNADDFQVGQLQLVFLRHILPEVFCCSKNKSMFSPVRGVISQTLRRKVHFKQGEMGVVMNVLSSLGLRP